MARVCWPVAVSQTWRSNGSSGRANWDPSGFSAILVVKSNTLPGIGKVIIFSPELSQRLAVKPSASMVITALRAPSRLFVPWMISPGYSKRVELIQLNESSEASHSSTITVDGLTNLTVLKIDPSRLNDPVKPDRVTSSRLPAGETSHILTVPSSPPVARVTPHHSKGKSGG